jgi:hypothetical protein
VRTKTFHQGDLALETRLKCASRSLDLSRNSCFRRDICESSQNILDPQSSAYRIFFNGRLEKSAQAASAREDADRISTPS